MPFELTEHARCILKERNIREEWVWEAVKNPDGKETQTDNNTHYFKRIPENGNRVLHVVVTLDTLPERVVTVFFDRREKVQK